MSDTYWKFSHAFFKSHWNWSGRGKFSMTGIDIEKDEQQNIRNDHIFEMAQSGLSCLKTPTTAKYTVWSSLLIVSEDKDCFCTARIRQWTSYSYITFIGTLFLWFRMHIQNWCQFNSVLYTVSFFYNWHKKINNLWGNFITNQAGVSKMTFPTS